LYSLRNRPEKLAKGSLFCLFLKLVQIIFLFTDNVRILYIYLKRERKTCQRLSLIFLFLTLVQINVIFGENVCTVYIEWIYFLNIHLQAWVMFLVIQCTIINNRGSGQCSYDDHMTVALPHNRYKFLTFDITKYTKIFCIMNFTLSL
jgi:hypothetical protein